MITVIVIFMLLIHFVLAVSVFADAKARNMNAVVWAVIVFIGICFVGLIIYAIVREPIRDYKCGVCDAGVDINDNICGKCGAVFNGKCQKCGSDIESGWVVCPNCDYVITEKISKKIPVMRKKNNSFIIAIIGIIGLTLIFLINPIYLINGSHSYETTVIDKAVTSNITKEDISKSETLAEWTNTFEDKEAYMLVNRRSGIVYLYINNNEKYLKAQVQREYADGMESVDSGDICFYLETVRKSDNMGFNIFVLDDDNKFYSEAKYSVYLDDEKIECEITFTEENIDISSWKEK